MEAEQIHGTGSMCPQDEIRLRERENLVHVLEVVGREKKLVKSYSRSAANSNMVVPHHLRPYPVLKDTVEYLLLEVAKRCDVALSVVYDFVNDRLRAVRQDMTIQRLRPAECVQLLEPMVRFYVYFGYRLHGLPIRDYDPVLNKQYLLECIKWYLSCCDTLENAESNSNADNLTNAFDGLRVNSHQLSNDRVLVESLYILCNLDDINPLLRYISLSKYLKTDPRLQLSYKIALANLEGNFVRVGRLLQKLCPLSYCALCLHLPTMQRRALEVVCVAYNSKSAAVPSAALRRWLTVASEWEARAVALHYGLSLRDSLVCLHKRHFKLDAPMHTPKIQLLDGSTNLDIDYIFTYKL